MSNIILKTLLALTVISLAGGAAPTAIAGDIPDAPAGYAADFIEAEEVWTLSATYTCNWSEEISAFSLFASFVDVASGKEFDTSLPALDFQRCKIAAAALNKAKAEIRKPSVIALCSMDAKSGQLYLRRRLVKSDLSVLALKDIPIHQNFRVECESTADAINTRSAVPPTAPLR